MEKNILVVLELI